MKVHMSIERQIVIITGIVDAIEIKREKFYWFLEIKCRVELGDDFNWNVTQFFLISLNIQLLNDFFKLKTKKKV